MNKTNTILNSAIIIYFIIGLEILIMISPFAGLFYAVFNPVLRVMVKYPATKWLSAFFLPHMVVPPDDFLKFVRIMGSILFVLGMAIFFISAIQVYASKFLNKGAVLKGFYSLIRHPQYLGLGIAGIGLSILWPRFLVVVLWLVMILIYYFLSKDEERRMLKAYYETYKQYMDRTGMFLPKAVEKIISPTTVAGKTLLLVLIAAITLGSAFFLRGYTVRHLPLWSDTAVVAIAIVPEDVPKMEHRMGDVLILDEVHKRMQSGERYLVYFLPPHYIMQGLIADTGGEWKLYKQHHAISMIADWIFHPFRHLQEGHHAMHGTLDLPEHQMNAETVRRLVFLKVTNMQGNRHLEVFSINAVRTPVFMADVDIHNLNVLSLKDLPQDTAWGTLPAPLFWIRRNVYA